MINSHIYRYSNGRTVTESTSTTTSSKTTSKKHGSGHGQRDRYRLEKISASFTVIVCGVSTQHLIVLAKAFRSGIDWACLSCSRNGKSKGRYSPHLSSKYGTLR